MTHNTQEHEKIDLFLAIGDALDSKDGESIGKALVRAVATGQIDMSKRSSAFRILVDRLGKDKVDTILDNLENLSESNKAHAPSTLISPLRNAAAPSVSDPIMKPDPDQNPDSNNKP